MNDKPSHGEYTIILCCVVAFLIAILGVSAHCQEPPHKFSKKYVFAQAALVGADAFFTQQNTCRFDWKHCNFQGIQEWNPIARPFVTSGSRAEIAGYFSAELVAKLGSAYWIHRTRHHRLERWVEISNLGSSAAGVVYSGKGFFERR